MNEDKIMVSVLVLVYNHEKYLEQCLNSIVKQKTNFKYEVLIHDDCSQDNSEEIIKRFHKRYPDIIKPFYEKENQYSKGVKITIDILVPQIKGKYFCFCEGDDYWIDEKKLQKQFDFLENNNEYKLCVHNSIGVNKNGREISKIIVNRLGGDLCCEDFILGGGEYVSTNSIFSYSSLAKNTPSYFKYMSLDYVWQIYLSSSGKTYCFKDFMSAYRINSDNSWSRKMINNPNLHIEHKKKTIEVLKMFNEYTSKKYEMIIEKRIHMINFKILELKKDYKTMKKSPYKEIRKNVSHTTKIKFFFDEHFPQLYKLLYKLLKK